MSLPDFRELETGDVTDDDPQVLDDLVKQQANPVPPLPDEMVSQVVTRPKRITRLQTGMITLQPGWDPVRILAPDADRESLTLAMDSALTTDTVNVADTPDSARNGGSMFQANPISLSGHTGAVWVYNPTANAIRVSYWAVTC